MPKNNIFEIKPEGKITSTTSGSLKALCIKDIEKTPCDHVVLDLSGVSFMDSSGISMIVSIDKLCRKKGKGFSVQKCPAKILSLFKIMNLHKVIPMSVE